ncbi:methyltransferase domain-containing protein [Neptuniibacter sp. QD37_6]|uniref:class I SAM-dependent methyltransferase n=1 Tax=Neptuniibacter sp. QD37_6 TaxID=3398210 RepID=UPI0039F44B9E
MSENINSLSKHKSYFLINLDETVDIDYSYCADCGFIFQANYVGDDFLNRYYENSPMLRRREPTEYEIDQNFRQGAFLSKTISLEGKSVLEIGAHAGAFLRYLHDEHKCKTYFVELSDEANQVLSSIDGLSDFNSLDKSIELDLVVIRHVLEHIHDIDNFLDYISSITSDQGLLFVEVPDWSWMDESTDPLMFEHLNQFNVNNLTQFLSRRGWIVESLEKSISDNDPATKNRVLRVLAKKAPPSLSDTKSHFHDFYSKTYDRVNHFINTWVETNAEDTKVGLYPASHLTFAALQDTKICEAEVVGIFDIDEKKSGISVAGVEIKHSETLVKNQPDVIFLFTLAYEEEIKQYLCDLGVNAEIICLSGLLK